MAWLSYFPPLFLLCLRVSLLLALFGHCGRSAKTRIQSQGQMPWATHQLQSLRGWCLALGFGVSYHLILWICWFLSQFSFIRQFLGNLPPWVGFSFFHDIVSACVPFSWSVVVFLLTFVFISFCVSFFFLLFLTSLYCFCQVSLGLCKSNESCIVDISGSCDISQVL